MRTETTGFRYARERLALLNGRQREVLDLLTKGLTNGQIAERLGMTLDGAKWNVSEILGKLGFESREQAAEFWRRERPGVLSPRRVLAGIPLWVRIAGSAGAAVAVGLAIVLFLLGGDDRELGAEGVWLAFASEQDSFGHSPLRIVNLDTGERKQLDESGTHIAVDFSPDGTRLAALTMDPSGASGQGSLQQTLKIWSVPVWDLIADVEIEGPASYLTASDLAWSPDSTRIALFGHGVSIYDFDGELVGSVLGTLNPDGSLVGSEGEYGDNSWSPDSRYVARIFNKRLLIAHRDGTGVEADLPQSDPADPFSPAALVDWSSPDGLRVTVGPKAETVFVFTATVGGDAVTWDGGQRVSFEEAYGVDLTRAPEFEALVTGSVYGGTSAMHDGVTEVSVLQSEAMLGDGLHAVWLVVNRGDEQVIVHLGEQQPRGTFSSFDVAITPRASGDLRGDVDLAEYGLEPPVKRILRPRQTPPTPDPAAPPQGMTREKPPHPAFSKTQDPNVTVIPYPTPLGERVQPQLTGLPAFPGAEEIDGFTMTMEYQARGSRTSAEAAVQHFAVEATPEEVHDFFWDALAAGGFLPEARGYSEGGQQWMYVRGQDRVWIMTEYVRRPGDEHQPGEQPYGFRGNNVQFLEGAAGKTWFFVATIRGN